MGFATPAVQITALICGTIIILACLVVLLAWMGQKNK